MSKKKGQADVQEGTERKSRLGFFQHNSVIAAVSVVAAIAAWFFVTITTVSPDDPIRIDNVPIVIQYADAAVNSGLYVFDKTQDTADIYIKANSSLAKALTAADFTVTATLSPSSTKTSGTGLITTTLALRATKVNSLADYEIASVEPSEISVQYDRKKEVTLDIKSNITRTAATGFYAEEPSYSDTSVTISGPESTVNQIDQAVIEESFNEPLSASKDFTAPIVLYGQDRKRITDYKSQFLTLSTENVNVHINVLSKKTVKLEPVQVNQPKSLSGSRMEISPGTIDIAGSAEDLQGIESILLSGTLDFSKITLTSEPVGLNIPIPQNVKNISNVDTAEVRLNLGGYSQKQVTTTSITLSNAVKGEAEILKKSIAVTVIGSDAQIEKITGNMVNVIVDLSGQKGVTGNVELPAKIVFSDSADTCWAVGDYTVTVAMGTAAANAVASETSQAMPRE